MTINISLKLRRLAALALVGCTAILTGCAVVPADPYYTVGSPVVYPDGYYQSYGAPYYAAPPLYVAPPVSIGIWGNFSGGHRWHGGGGHRGDWRGARPGGRHEGRPGGHGGGRGHRR